MGAYVLDLKEIDGTMQARAGDKGFNLGVLTGIREILVPEGFCVTAEAYLNVTRRSEEIRSLLNLLRPYNRDWIDEVCSKIRYAIEKTAIPKVIQDEIAEYLEHYGEDSVFAVRSSAAAATTATVPTGISFAGRHDTYLNVSGLDALLIHISKCWASFFSERAVVYRIENGIDHSTASMAVIVQRMVYPDLAGRIVTADPVNSDRKTIMIYVDSGPGDNVRNDAANACSYKIRDGAIIEKNIPVISSAGYSAGIVSGAGADAGLVDATADAAGPVGADIRQADADVGQIDADTRQTDADAGRVDATGQFDAEGQIDADAGQIDAGAEQIDATAATIDITAMSAIGEPAEVAETTATIETTVEPVDVANNDARALADDQLLQLEQIGRAIETHYGCPQRVEWYFGENRFYIMQSRPIAALYPLPGQNNDKRHIYMTIGFRHNTTDAIKPLGLSFLQMADSSMIPIGGRPYVDIARDMASPIGRVIINAVLDNFGSPMTPALKDLTKRKGFIESLERGKKTNSINAAKFIWKLAFRTIGYYRKKDPVIIAGLKSQNETKLAELANKMDALSGEPLLDAIKDDFPRFFNAIYDANNLGVVYAGILAMRRLNKKMEKWLGEKNAGDALMQPANNSIAAKMGLDLLDVADVVRQYPAVMEYMRHARNRTFYDYLDILEGGEHAAESISAYLDKYGMRCIGEDDITQPRWSEAPAALAPLILSYIANYESGAGAAIHKKNTEEAENKKQEILSRLERLPGGKQKSKEAIKMINTMREYLSYSEYPRYYLACYFWLIKKILLSEADTLARNSILKEREDVYYLTLDELKTAIRLNAADYGLIESRKTEYEMCKDLKPPRLMTSDGEIITGGYGVDKLPGSAMAGAPLSSGIAEGRAKVARNLEDADVGEDTILVVPYVDNSWTPAYISIKGLIAEADAAALYGSIAEKEFRIPALAGVEGAVGFIKDGQTLRVNATEGYVEILR